MAVPMLRQLAAAAVVAQFLGLASAAVVPLQARDGTEPGLPAASDTTSYCTWWIDYDGSQTCEEVLDFNWIDMKSFLRWNPSVGSDCSGIKSGNSYCVEAFNEPTPSEEEETTTTTISTSTSTTTSEAITTPPPTTEEPSTTAPTTTSAGNGVETPGPIHNGMVGNCNKFYLVQDGDSCASIAQKNNIRAADLVSWNGLNSGCTNLWLDTYACVGLIGSNPTETATPTAPGNGVETPAPIHNGMVGNCNKFYLVQDGDSCASIAQKNNIRAADLVSWNGLNSGCTNLWLDTYACVGLIGSNPTDPPTTTTMPGNGVETPAPVHNGIVSNCNKFYLVKDGDTCASIAQKNNIRAADLVSWNGLNSGCSNLWLDTYACIGIIGGTPTVPPTTTTTAGNGIQTPQPTQPGIASNCDKFHLVGDGDSCASIAKANGISTAQFAQWNSLNGACSNLWGSVYACVRVVGFTPTPTNPGNGVETPQPTQGSIVANCKKFELVRSGDTCDTVAKRRGITVKQMTTWNPSIGSDCKKLWANAYACVGV